MDLQSTCKNQGTAEGLSTIQAREVGVCDGAGPERIPRVIWPASLDEPIGSGFTERDLISTIAATHKQTNSWEQLKRTLAFDYFFLCQCTHVQSSPTQTHACCSYLRAYGGGGKGGRLGSPVSVFRMVPCVNHGV